MRLTAQEVRAIEAATRLTFGADAVVRLFGSRIDDARRGGDIDLHVETAQPMDVERIDALAIEQETLVLAFLKRFEQLEDKLDHTLKAISQAMGHGRIERLTSVDVTRRAWALGILDSEKVWAAVVHASNTLAHDYPPDPAKRVIQLNTAWATRATLDTTRAAIGRFVEDEGLLA